MNNNQEVNNFLKDKASEILEFSRSRFTQIKERGFVTVVAKDSPDNPFKSGQFYYTTEKENEQINLGGEKTETDILLEKHLREYNPRSEAVVLVWYRTFSKAIKFTDTLSWN